MRRATETCAGRRRRNVARQQWRPAIGAHGEWFAVMVGVIASASACASAPPASLDPTPAGLRSVQAVKPTDAATDFQSEAEAIKRMGEPPDWGNVRFRMEGLVRRHPRYGLAWYNLGVAYERLGETDKAADAYRRALAVNDQLREAQLNLASLAVERGDRDEAVSLLETLVERDPGAVGARVALASYRLEQDKFDDAERLAKEALARNPENIGGYCVLARLFVARKQDGKARLVVAQGFKIDEDAACLHLALGRLLLDDGDTAAALVSLEQAVKRDPALSEARFLIAETSMSFKDFQRAIEHYRIVADRAPDPGPALVNLGVAYKGSGQFAEAEQAYQSATTFEESAPAAHFNLGVLYLRHLERIDDAEKSLRRYLELTDTPPKEALALLDEVEQMKKFREAEVAAAEEAARQAEIEAKAAAEAAARGEVVDGVQPHADQEEAADTPPIPSAPPKADPRKTPTKAPPPKQPPEGLEPDDFE